MKRENRKMSPIYGHYETQLIYGNRSPINIAAGRGDAISLHRRGPLTYVLTLNEPLGYAGLEVIEWYPNPRMINDIFVQNVAENIDPYLPKPFFSYSHCTKVDILREYMDD